MGLTFLLWTRWSRPAKEDPRLSKGLQLLQSKIAILEDLSDRTDHQTSQLVTILEAKIKEIQKSIHESEVQVQKINQRTQKSLEVAKIFQDKIPHDEIIERKNTIKYVKAARMAHQGESIEKIMDEVGLSRAEIELIAKMNREQLVFSEEQLPEWVNEEDVVNDESRLDDFHQTSGPIGINLNQVFNVPKSEMESLKKLGEAFKMASGSLEKPQATSNSKTENVESESINSEVINSNKVNNSERKPEAKLFRSSDESVSLDAFEKAAKEALSTASQPILTEVGGKLKNVQPYQFKKIDSKQNSL